MRPVVVAWILVVLSFAGSVNGGIFDITSQVTVSTITNNFQTQQQTTNGVSTSPGFEPFTVTGINGLNDTVMTINPKGIIATYDISLVAWVPKQARLEVVTAELSPNPRNRNISSSNTFRTAGGFRPIKVVNTNKTDMVVGQYGDIADFFRIAACYSGFAPISIPVALAGQCSGGSGISADQFSRYA